MIARLVAAYVAVFAVVLAALSVVAYLFVGSQYHSLLLPALSTPEGMTAYAQAMRRVLLDILAFDVPLLIVVGIASWILARLSVAPWLQAREREREFIADASHSLRSPLATISAAAQAAKISQPESVAEALDVITRTSLDASAVIGDLLTLARSPSPSLIQSEPVDLAAIARDCAAEFRSRAGAAEIQLSERLESAIVEGDERRLRELLRNVLENATRYARRQVDIRCEAAGRAILTVTDDGPGIAPEIRERIFERFFCNGDEAGTGLGLSIAQWIVQAHKGSISVRDASPGAAFVIEIPLLRA